MNVRREEPEVQQNRQRRHNGQQVSWYTKFVVPITIAICTCSTNTDLFSIQLSNTVHI